MVPSWFPPPFLSSLYLSCVLVSFLSHVRSLLIGQWGRVKHRDTALMSLVFHHSLPLCSFLSFFLFTRPLLTTNFSANSTSSVVVVAVHIFFSCVFEGCCLSWNSITYSERLPDVSFWSPACCVGVACHRPLPSPQWLATLSRRLLTDRCWLTNQQLSTTNLCSGPSRLTVFCVTVTELKRW